MKTINNLVDYIDTVALPRGMTMYTRTMGSMSIFRGQSNVDWDLAPSVFRGDIYKNESAIIREFERLCPNEFEGLTYIEKLIKMQHYNLPTRLLDFSTNPLVALFFACVDNPDINGAVYAFHGFPMYSQSLVWVSIIMKYLFEFDPYFFKINDMLDELKLDPGAYPTRGVVDFHNPEELMRILTMETMGIYPKITNGRIDRQDGVFMMFGMSVKEITRKYIIFDKTSVKNEKEIWKYAEKYVIPKECKYQILKDLEKIGINRYKLFPELEYKSEFVLNYINHCNFTNMGMIDLNKNTKENK